MIFAILLVACLAISSASPTLTATNSYYVSTTTVSTLFFLNSFFFKFGKNQTTFEQGWAYCQNADMKFVSIPTSSQNEALATYLSSLGAPSGLKFLTVLLQFKKLTILAEFWIGGIYLRHGFLTQWYWVDGVESFSWTNFNVTPSLSTSYDNCIAYSYNSSTHQGTWVAQNCANNLYFVCSE